MKIFVYCLLLTTLVSCNICKLFGSHDLGSNFVLFEGDRVDDTIIVYCTTQKGCCDAGIPAVPEHVENVDFNKRWIIARVINKDKTLSYWIIDKDFELDLEKCRDINCREIINSNITGPLTLAGFKAEKERLGIHLDLD